MRRLTLHTITTMLMTLLSPTLFAAVNYQGGAGSMGNITISATVSDACNIDISDLGFGAYDPNATSATTGDSTITYTCTKNSTPQLSFASTTLEMSGPGSDVLSYTLHQGTGGSGTLWTSSANYALPTATGSSQTSNYSGSISANQFVQTGSYSQDLTMTLSF